MIMSRHGFLKLWCSIGVEGQLQINLLIIIGKRFSECEALFFIFRYVKSTSVTNRLINQGNKSRFSSESQHLQGLPIYVATSRSHFFVKFQKSALDVQTVIFMARRIFYIHNLDILNQYMDPTCIFWIVMCGRKLLQAFHWQVAFYEWSNKH